MSPRAPHPRPRRGAGAGAGAGAATGFTLIELMVTLAIAAILLVIAAPSFSEFRRNSELTSATNTLIASINAARGEAMKRNMSAFVVPTDGSAWDNGWTVFVDTNNSNAYESASDLVVSTQPAQPVYLDITGNFSAGGSAPYIMFNPSGYATVVGGGFSNLTLSLARNDVENARVAGQTRRIIIAKTGRVRSCKPATDADCLVSTTN